MATQTPATRRRDSERARVRERRRGELLDVADEVIQRDGPHVSMDDIASEAGITKPVLYRHFGDKDGLYMALTERYIAELVVALRSAVEAGDPRSRLAATIDAYLSYVEREPERYRFLLHASEQPRTAPLMSGLPPSPRRQLRLRSRREHPTRRSRSRVRQALGRVRDRDGQGGGNVVAREPVDATGPARRVPDDDPLGRFLVPPQRSRRKVIQLGVTLRNPLCTRLPNHLVASGRRIA